MNMRVVFILFLFFLGIAAFGAANEEPLPATAGSGSPSSDASSEESMSPDVAYGFPSYNNVAGKFDRNGDGRIDLIVVDRNGDGRGDYWATDRNFDGLIDDYQYDRNFDGQIDQWEYDTFHNGVPEKIYVDSKGGGRPDMYAVLNPMTRTYSWYGDMSTLSSAQKSYISSIRPKRKLRHGKAADSE